MATYKKKKFWPLHLLTLATKKILFSTTTTMIPSTSSSSSTTSVTLKICVHQRKKKKKKKQETETWVAMKEAWVTLRPGSRAAWLCLWVSTWYFSHHSYILRDWTINKHLQKAVVQKLYKISELINRVSKTRFPNSRHMEKMPHQAWSDHGKTRFIDPKSSLLDSRC